MVDTKTRQFVASDIALRVTYYLTRVRGVMGMRMVGISFITRA
jgi:hypothetical protein